MTVGRSEWLRPRVLQHRCRESLLLRRCGGCARGVGLGFGVGFTLGAGRRFGVRGGVFATGGGGGCGGLGGNGGAGSGGGFAAVFFMHDGGAAVGAYLGGFVVHGAVMPRGGRAGGTGGGLRIRVDGRGGALRCGAGSEEGEGKSCCRQRFEQGHRGFVSLHSTFLLLSSELLARLVPAAGLCLLGEVRKGQVHAAFSGHACVGCRGAGAEIAACGPKVCCAGGAAGARVACNAEKIWQRRGRCGESGDNRSL